MLMLIDDANNRLKRDYVVASGVLHAGEQLTVLQCCYKQLNYPPPPPARYSTYYSWKRTFGKFEVLHYAEQSNKDYKGQAIRVVKLALCINKIEIGRSIMY